jgi:hypothetical protein
MMKICLTVLTGIICFFCSCKSTRNIQTAVAKKDTVVTVNNPVTDHAHEDSIRFIKDTYQGIRKNYINFTSFSAKIDLDYEDADGKKYNVNAHVRMYKDSVIWISITAILGIEGLRVMITPDSVKLLNKQDKVYMPRSVSFLQEVTALPLDLPTLQDLFLGNPVFLDTNIVSYSKSGTTISLQSNGNFFKNLFTVGEADKLVQTSKLDDIDKLRSRTCYLTYSDYEDEKGPDGYKVNFSRKRTIHVAEKKKLDIKMDFKQVDFNEKLSFPFSVPKNYDEN